MYLWKYKKLVKQFIRILLNNGRHLKNLWEKYGSNQKKYDFYLIFELMTKLLEIIKFMYLFYFCSLNILG
jgi:uncharacterized protein YaaR (DUF327 family)